MKLIDKYSLEENMKKIVMAAAAALSVFSACAACADKNSLVSA